jgi:hypothetical protein
MRNNKWVRLLAYVTGSVNQELLIQNEYLAAKNRILRSKMPPRLRLSNPERITLAEIGKRLLRLPQGSRDDKTVNGIGERGLSIVKAFIAGP